MRVVSSTFVAAPPKAPAPIATTGDVPPKATIVQFRTSTPSMRIFPVLTS